VANRKLGKYEVLERLGRGGMAEVYRAYHANLDRHVAIKVLHTFLADDPEFKTRFEREAQNIAKLRHPNIVQVYDFDYDDEGGSYYMVMELISGVTLKDRNNELESESRFLPLVETLRIVREAASALAYAHSRNMIHRDVKPANLMMDSHDNRVVLTDFGIAKIVTGAQFTVSGGMVGTPAYMAPEQGLGEAGDERSDLYSLGVIFYQLTTGRLPYEAETPLAVILKHLHEPVPLAREINPGVTQSVEMVISKLMAKKPNDRYQTAAELIADLERIERGDTIEFTESVRDSANIGAASILDTYILPKSTPKTPIVPPAPPRRAINGWIAGGLLMIAVILVGFLLVGAANGMFTGIGLFPTATATDTATLPFTNTPNPTITPSQTDTFTPSPTSTDTPTETPSPEATEASIDVLTPEETEPPTVTLTPSRTPRISSTPSVTRRPTITRTPTPTSTPTRTPTRTPSPTRTLSPTPRISATPTLDITGTVAAATLQATSLTATFAACRYNYEIVDQDPPDGEFFTINTEYVREITLRNTGTCAWAPLTSLVFISGENFSVGPSIRLGEEVSPREEIIVLFEGQTPSETGILTGIWQLRTPGLQPIGDPIEISVNLYDPGPGG
jgi:serine/threonine protein kinase